MINRLLVTAWILGLVTAVSAQPRPKRPLLRDWTVMFYLNGIDDLERSAECALLQTFAVTTTARVTVIVQAGLSGANAPGDGTVTQQDVPCPPYKALYWRGVRRFVIVGKPGVGTSSEGVYMGSRLDLRNPDALEGFVRWSLSQYPAHHYALIIKDHGAGTPYLLVNPNLFANKWLGPALTKSPDVKTLQMSPQAEFMPYWSSHSAMDSIIFDPNGNLLLNWQIRGALKNALGQRRLDIIGFDSCFKAMLETGYAMRDVAHILVASEATQFDYGWNHTAWLSQLVLHPEMNRLSIANKMVDSFAERDKQDPSSLPVTLSSTNLDALNAIISPLDLLANILSSKRISLDIITQARKACRALEVYDVDLDCFAGKIASNQSSEDIASQEVAQLGSTIQNTIRSTVVSHANKPAEIGRGARGLAIYFPACARDAGRDPNRENYNPENPQAIPFAKKHLWSVFIKNYLQDREVNCGPPPTPQ